MKKSEMSNFQLKQPVDFVAKQRAALESEHVSKNFTSGLISYLDLSSAVQKQSKQRMFSIIRRMKET